MPTCVADMCRSSWISGMTGGTARSVSRKALPASHNNRSAIQISRADVRTLMQAPAKGRTYCG
jgi:hypothetical protein